MQTDLDATLPTFDQIDGDQITYDIVVLISMRLVFLTSFLSFLDIQLFLRSIAGGQTLYHIRLAINIRSVILHYRSLYS